MPANPNGQAPVESSLEAFPLQLLYDFNGATLEREVLLDVYGTEKSITKGNGDTIGIAPNLKGTLTDVATGETFDFVFTGSIQRSENEDGTFDVTYNGLNLVGNPYLDADGDGDLAYALVQTRGHFTQIQDPSGTTPEEIYGPLDGNGQILYIVDDIG